MLSQIFFLSPSNVIYDEMSLHALCGKKRKYDNEKVGLVPIKRICLKRWSI